MCPCLMVFCPLCTCSELACLAREAQFFGLPGLLDRINGTAIVPEPNTRAVYDSIYLETGFSSIEGPNIKEMEQRKVGVVRGISQRYQNQKQCRMPGVCRSDCHCIPTKCLRGQCSW
jgi:hypothetical protein